MFRMGEEGAGFRAWINKQSILGAAAVWHSEFHALFAPGTACAYITFLPFRDDHEIVELRIQRSDKAKPSFLTHFVLSDIWRARQLFREMAKALEVETRRGTSPVLVCCDKSVPHHEDELEFVRRLQEVSHEISIAYDFLPLSVEDVLAYQDPHVATMLMPSVSELQHTIHEACKDAVTFCIPPQALARKNARLGLRLLLEALGEIDTLSVPAPAVHQRHTPGKKGTALVLNIMYCDRCVRMGWRVYHDLQKIAAGNVTKAVISLKDLHELIGTLFLYGIDIHKLDAIEVLVPGVVNFCSMNMPSLGDRDSHIVEKIEEAYGIPTSMDNNTNAAAMGCYLLQDECESITLYRHQLGHMNGGQGTVIGGHLVTGRYGMAGEPKLYQRRFRYGLSYSDQVWTVGGLAEISRDVVLASVGTIEPEAVYLSVSTMEDLGAFRAELERRLPKYCIPELHTVDDYRERMYVGGAALSLSRL